MPIRIIRYVAGVMVAGALIALAYGAYFFTLMGGMGLQASPTLVSSTFAWLHIGAAFVSAGLAVATGYNVAFAQFRRAGLIALMTLGTAAALFPLAIVSYGAMKREVYVSEQTLALSQGSDDPSTIKQAVSGAPLVSADPGALLAADPSSVVDIAPSLATAAKNGIQTCTLQPEGESKDSWARSKDFYRCLDQTGFAGPAGAFEPLMKAVEDWYADDQPGVPYTESWTHLLSIDASLKNSGLPAFLSSKGMKLNSSPYMPSELYFTGLPARDRAGRTTGDIVLAIAETEFHGVVTLVIMGAKGSLGRLGDAQDGKYFGVFYPIYDKRGDLVRLVTAPLPEVWLDLRDLPFDYSLEDQQTVLLASDEIHSFSGDPLVVYSAPGDGADSMLVNSEGGRRAILLALGIDGVDNPYFENRPTGIATGDWLEVDAVHVRQGNRYCGETEEIAATVRGWVRWRDAEGQRLVDYTRNITC